MLSIIKSNKTIMLLFSLSCLAVAFIFFVKGQNNFDITSILQEAGMMNPPKWLVYSLMGVTTAGAVFAILAGAGIFFLPLWAGEALAGAVGAAQ
ncbi:hypothetical protein Q8G37_26640 [Bacillus wiedmannii]|uniref:hypothetical protein n=1 Tax=Bacillus wiedmannii TaxID=1890302 RepID=UPI00273085C1|nr:hypothetical protein [Bacillus wiedmannii]MDP1459951.1 hypothetical protein [Bacillus wiedmannii]